jgi:hypothetical protein
MTDSPPETVSVPKYLLVEFEDGFSRLWLVVREATSQIEKGEDPQLLAPILRPELNSALNTLAAWRLASGLTIAIGPLLESPLKQNSRTAPRRGTTPPLRPASDPRQREQLDVTLHLLLA